MRQTLKLTSVQPLSLAAAAPFADLHIRWKCITNDIYIYIYDIYIYDIYIYDIYIYDIYIYDIYIYDIYIYILGYIT